MECSVWVFVGSSLVIAVCRVVPDRRVMVLIRMMVASPLLNQKDTAGTICLNQSLMILTWTWVGVNIVSLLSSCTFN